MKLVDEAEFKKLLSTVKIEETVSGGSVANLWWVSHNLETKWALLEK